ncbi:hypothetical protein ACVBGC_03090 [Burkholderia stagnalis]
MHRDPSSPSATADDWLQHLPGFRLFHTIHLVSDIDPNVVAQAAVHLENERARVNHWAVVKRGNILEQRIVLDDIGERQARGLREQLLALENVLRVRLEHRLVRRCPDAMPTHALP